MPKAPRWPARPYPGPSGSHPPLLSRKRLDFRSASVHSLANGAGVQRKVAGDCISVQNHQKKKKVHRRLLAGGFELAAGQFHLISLAFVCGLSEGKVPNSVNKGLKR
jgi:hypothetical protein